MLPAHLRWCVRKVGGFLLIRWNLPIAGGRRFPNHCAPMVTTFAAWPATDRSIFSSPRPGSALGSRILTWSMAGYCSWTVPGACLWCH